MQLEFITKPEEVATSTAVTWQRRYDVDWLRTLAMGLLIIYHVVVGFQPWASFIGFIQNEQPLEELWIIMSLLNVWRIPIVFMISGMGVRFAIERRDWKQLLKDRTLRILLPFIFGFFFITPISAYLLVDYYDWGVAYIPNPGHLWFLANIFLYVLLLLPLLFYLKNRPDNVVLRFLANVMQRPWGLFILAIPMMLEAWLVNPEYFSAYALTPHGFWLGMVCFITGFVFIAMKGVFWQAVERVRLGALVVAFLLYLVRLMVFELDETSIPNALIAFESLSWMLAILGYGSIYLNKPSSRLSYFSQAVYPVYIVHLPVQYAISYYLLPLPLPAILKLIVLLIGTFGVSLFMYEYALRRLKWIRPLFGMKLNHS